MVAPFPNLPDIFVDSLAKAMKKDKIMYVLINRRTCMISVPENCEHVHKLCDKCGVRAVTSGGDDNVWETVKVDDNRLNPSTLW